MIHVGKYSMWMCQSMSDMQIGMTRLRQNEREREIIAYSQVCL